MVFNNDFDPIFGGDRFLILNSGLGVYWEEDMLENWVEGLVLITILCGFFGIVFKKNLVMKIISMDVMSTGVIAYYVVIASRIGFFTPILVDSQKGAYADPVPQAVILTAIVIGFSIQALMLVGVMKLARNNPTLETHEIEKSSTV